MGSLAGWLLLSQRLHPLWSEKGVLNCGGLQASSACVASIYWAFMLGQGSYKVQFILVFTTSLEKEDC